MEAGRLERTGHPALRYAVFAPESATKGSVLLTPGFAEHVGRYEHVAEAWSAAGFAVAVYDPRGQGRSEGRRAYVESFDDFVLDALALLDALGAHPAFGGRRPILFGHSMGALISAHVALVEPERFTGLALSSPFFGQALATPEWKKRLGRFASKLWPTYTDVTNITASLLTHDAERARSIDLDPLRIPYVTARWFTEIEGAQTRLFTQAERLRLPVFCLAAGEDRIASVAETRRVFERIGSDDKRLIVAEDEYHELHQELRRSEHIATFARAFERWCQ